MIENPRELLEAIRLGEDARLELKEVRVAGRTVKGPSRDSLADELAAFANASGGTCILGVHDRTREVLGIPEPLLDKVEKLVLEVCQDQLDPPLYPMIRKGILPGPDGSDRPILRIDVPRSLFVHRSPGGYLYRVGSSKRIMTTDFLARLVQQRSQGRLIRFDEQVVPGTTPGDLDLGLLEKFRTPHSDRDAFVLARKLAMIADEEGTPRLTVAGALLGTRHPETWLPHAFVQAVAYRGTDIEGGPGYQLDARDLTGSLDQQVADACRFVSRNMRIEASKGMGRQDVPQYDLWAVFEALVNAVAHRDYAMYGSKIRLRMFADRLELYCPGQLPNTMGIDTLEVRQASRNEAIVSLLAKCPRPADIPGLDMPPSAMMERRGEGVPLILGRSERLSGKRPIYACPDPSELILTIFAASALDVHP